MKILLSISLLLNVALVAVLFNFMRPTVYERVVMETHKSNPMETDTVSTTMASPKKVELPKAETTSEVEPEVFPPRANEEEMVDTHQRLESQRTEFLTSELDLSPEAILEFQRLRNDFMMNSSKVWGDHPFGEPTFEARRQLLEMEEKLHQDLIKVLGKKNFERYQAFREEYNKRGFDRQVEENQPFLFMGI